jgi:hypothetical protein
MSINISDFESILPMPKGCGERSSKILIFLNKNKDKAFTYKEIAEATNSNPDKIHGSLNYLLRVGVLRHKNPYWAINPSEKTA